MPDYVELVGEYDYTMWSYPGSDGQIKVLPGRLIDGTQVVGYVDEDQLQRGVTYLFRGVWVEHPKYGKQFIFQTCGIAQPIGERGTVNYLQRGPHIGEKRAKELWLKYGKDALEVVRERPEEIAAAIAGLTEEKAKEAAAWFNEHKDQERTVRGLEEMGLTKWQQKAVIAKWGSRSGEMIRDNAFVLMTIRGFGFGFADKIYLKLGGNPASVERIGWCAWNAIHRERDGNTWVDIRVCFAAISESVSGIRVDPQAGILWAKKNGHIVSRLDKQGKEWLSNRLRDASEDRLANAVCQAIMDRA